MNAVTDPAPVRIDLVGGPLCGVETITEKTTGGDPPAIYVSTTGGHQYLRTTLMTADTDQDGRKRPTGWRRYEYVVPAALRGLPRPKRDRQCCEMPGRGCPTYGPEQTP